MKILLGARERYPWVSEYSARDLWGELTVEIPDDIVLRYRAALKEFEAAYSPILKAYTWAESKRDAQERAERIKREEALTPCAGCGQEFNEAGHRAHRLWCAPLIWPAAKT